MLNKLMTILLITALIVGCTKENETKDNNPQIDKMDNLITMMSGSFTSFRQASSDSDFFDIRLEMVQIWKEDTTAKWLYVEQAASSALETPYRQRVYKVEQIDDTTFASSVYMLPDPTIFIGAFNDPTLFDSIIPDSLTAREGCTVYLTAQSDSLFSGSTKAEECISSLRGASYATSKVTVSSHGIESWDRGFDSTGVQVWGAEKGAYIFERLEKVKAP